MEIIPVKYGESVLPEEMIFINGNKNKFREIVFKIYLVKDESKLILIDAGCETMPGFVMRNFTGAVKALENINISPKEITDVIITHAHHDHIECVKYFNNATIHIQKDEYESGKQYIPVDFKVNVLVAGDECYLRECLDNKIPTGSSFNQKASREFIEKYSDKKYTVLLCHDD